MFIPAYSGPDTNETGIELGCNDHDTLWDLEEDPAQRKDLSEVNPELLARMKNLFLELAGSHYDAGHEADPLQ